MDADIQKRFAALESKIAILEARDKEIEDGFGHYIESHGAFHRELYDMIYSSYCKTHPEYRASMDQYHDLIEGKSKRSDSPKG